MLIKLKKEYKSWIKNKKTIWGQTMEMRCSELFYTLGVLWGERDQELYFQLTSNTALLLCTFDQ